jgi:plastocyanin
VRCRALILLVVAAAALTLAGCGGEEEAEDGGTAASGAAQTVEIHETEFALEPDTVTLDSAGTYTFRAVNDGSVDHALEIEGNGVEDETETLAAGESGDVTVELQEGTYELYCPVGNHKDQGMVGRVVVGAGGAGGTTTDGETGTETGETETGETETDDDSNSGSGEGYGY